AAQRRAALTAAGAPLPAPADHRAGGVRGPALIRQRRGPTARAADRTARATVRSVPCGRRSPAVAAAATTTATAAVAARAAATTAAAAWTGLARLSFVHPQRAPVDLRAVHGLDCGLRIGVGRHLDEREAARAAGIAI